MSRGLILSLVFIIALTFMVSCSGGDGNLIAPIPTDRDTVATPTPGTTACFGLWQIVIDPATGTGDVVQLRNADKIINVLGFMEPPPLTSMDLDWPNLEINDPVIEVGVILKHPIPNEVFRGFDVRGVCFGPEVTNADGLTIIPGPEYFSGVQFGYQDGLLGTPDSIANYEGLAGYKYYCDGLGADEDIATFFSDTDNLDNRGSFGPGEINQRDYILDWTDSDQAFFIFNYAIYANYDWPVGDPPINLDYFPITTANSAEAFCASVTEVSNSLWFAGSSGGGTVSLDVEIWDWQDDISDVSIEASGVIPKVTLDTSTAGCTAYSHIYSFVNVPATPTATGELDIIITATDSATFGEAMFLGLLDSEHALYDAQVYNAWLFTIMVIDYSSVEWAPAVALSGGNVRARAGGTTPDSHSQLDSTSSFTVTGDSATGGNGGPYTYEYYVSDSSTDQSGSPLNWVEFTFPGDILITWGDYADMAPDRVYVWVQASDGTTDSTPVMCPTEMQLSRVIANFLQFSPGWTEVNGPVDYWPDFILNWPSYGYCFSGLGSYTPYWNRLHHTVPHNWGSTGLVTWECRLYGKLETPGNPPTTSYFNAEHGANASLGTVIRHWPGHLGMNGLYSESLNGFTGDRYIGFYAYDDQYPYYAIYFDDLGLYEDPI